MKVIRLIPVLAALTLLLAPSASHAELYGYGNFEMTLHRDSGEITGVFSFSKYSYFRSDTDFYTTTAGSGNAGTIVGVFNHNHAGRGEASLSFDAGSVVIVGPLCKFQILDKDDSSSPSRDDYLEFTCKVADLVIDTQEGGESVDLRGVRLQAKGSIVNSSELTPKISGKFVIGRR